MQDRVLVRCALAFLADVSETEPGLKHGQIVEDGRVDKVQQTPQLIEVILDGGSRQQQPVGGWNTLQALNQSAPVVLKPLTLVHHKVRELPDPPQSLLLLDGDLIARDDDRKRGAPPLLVMERPGQHRLPLRGGSVKAQHGQLRQPLLELSHPVGQSGEGRHDDERSRHVVGPHVRDHGDDLNGLAQSHLVGEYSRDAVLEQGHEPAEALQLVILEAAVVAQVARLDEDGLLLPHVRVVLRVRGLQRRLRLAAVFLRLFPGRFAVAVFLPFLFGRLLGLFGFLLCPRRRCALQLIEILGNEGRILGRLVQEKIELIFPLMYMITLLFLLLF
mmetsp:Transcript_39525/g.72921  ORF Transcript_39525/g.72921 Transcript_39525/m.72921 type:complete len:331 (+) Transcript_39525:1222-2214(+)